MSYVFHRRLASITADTAKAQNTDFLDTDFQVSSVASRVRITVAVTGGSRVRLVPSSGTGFNLLNGSSLSGTVATEELSLDATRTFNLQTDNVAGTTIKVLYVDELVPGRR